jgi:hypothetical protein
MGLTAWVGPQGVFSTGDAAHIFGSGSVLRAAVCASKRIELEGSVRLIGHIVCRSKKDSSCSGAGRKSVVQYDYEILGHGKIAEGGSFLEI